MSIIRNNLMTVEYYTPYCGGECDRMPRTGFNGQQFECNSCGWTSSFDEDFIAEYKAKWSLDSASLGGK